MKKVRAVVFDLDGTLINTKERFFKIFNETLEKLSLPTISRSVFEELYSNARLDEVIPKSIRRKFWKTFLVRYGQVSLDEDKPIPGVKNALRTLKSKGVLVCVVTGRACNSGSVWKELERHGLANYVDIVAAKNPNVKDHYLKEEEILNALRKAGIKANECIVVGDYLADIESGKKIGALTVAVLSGGVKKEVLESARPDIIIESVQKIPEVIDGKIKF